MTQRLRPGLFSLQTRLVIAMTSLILLGVVATGVVFVLRNRGDSERRELQSIAASAPSIFQRAAPFDIVTTNADGNTAVSFSSRVDRIASERGLRILLVDDTGTVLHDSADSLQGTIVSYPAPDSADLQRGYVAWAPGSPAPNFTFVASAGEPLDGSMGAPMPFAVPIGTDPGARPFGMVLGVETARIENAWLNALPGVGIAAVIVTPFAVILAVLLARQIARPVHQLTAASEAMARGDFDQRVEVGNREDEVGRLAQAFSVMAERVGERDAQMRALIANVSHDLKTPMTSIIGYAQALRDGVADTEKAADTIQRQANLAHDLLSDLLFLSEIDSGQSIRVATVCPVSEIVDATLLRVRAVADAKGIELSVEAGENATVSVDTEGMVRALSNVLANAVRFSEPGSAVEIEVTQTNGEVVISVQNEGPQVDEADLPYVFERFYRGRDQTGGHGLGLAIAREAVEMNAGHIELVNWSDGVRASINLPALNDESLSRSMNSVESLQS